MMQVRNDHHVCAFTGRLLKRKAKDSTASFHLPTDGLQPKTARIVQDGKIEEAPFQTIEKGRYSEVRAGDKIPVDGAK